MKWLAITTLFLIFSLKGIPQQGRADSLAGIISGLPDKTEKADMLLDLGMQFYQARDYDSAFNCYSRAYDLSQKLNYIPGLADAIYMKSVIGKIRSEYSASITMLEKYLELVYGLNDSIRMAKGLNLIGILHLDMQDHDLARFYCKKSLAIYLAKHDSFGLIANYNCLGSAFKAASEYDSAAFYYLEAAKLCELNGDERNLPLILNNLGDVYFFDQQYDFAMEYFKRSLEINNKNNNTRSIALNLLNIGRVYCMQNEYTKALGYYNQAAAIYSELKDKNSLANVDNNYGDLYFKQGKLMPALEKFNNALEGYRAVLSNKGIIVATMNKAAVYAEMGRNEEAKELQDSCLTLANEIGAVDMVVIALWNISDNYRRLGNYKSAFDYLMQHKILKDSVFNMEKSKTTIDLLLKYEASQKEARILSLEKENLRKTKQRNAYMFTGMGIIALTVFLILYFRQKAEKKRIIAEQRIRQLEEEKKLMQARSLVEGQEEERKRIATELHDGLGVLLSATKMQFSTIIAKSPENKELLEKASNMLEQASGDVRKISHNMMPGLLTRLGLYEAAEDLIEQISDGQELNATCTIEGNRESRLPENKEIMLYRIVQEMVNNTLKHAQAGNIELRMTILADKLLLFYKDDGVGFDFQDKIESESLGLKSIKSRVNFLNGKLDVESKPGEGVKYTVELAI